MKTILLAEKQFSNSAVKVLARVGKVIPFGSRSRFLKNLPKADAVVTGLEVKLTKQILRRAEKLRVIGSRTTQLRYIDIAECKRRGIQVVNIKADSSVLRRTPSTAEETMALLLSLMRNIPWAFDSIKRGRWDRKRYGGHELAEKTIGLIGFGRLGRFVARYAKSFGMSVQAYDPFVGAAEMRRHGAVKVSLGVLLRSSDVVSLHTVFNDETKEMLQESHFRMMRPHAVFINTARGEITDERALLKALKKKWIAGAAVDTLSNELPDGGHLKGNPLVSYAKTHENLIIVPHLGGATSEATERTMVYVSELVVAAVRRL